MQAQAPSHVIMDEIRRQALELTQLNARVAELRARMDAAPSDVDIEYQARQDLLAFNRAEVTRYEQALERAQREMDMIVRSGPTLRQEDPIEHTQLLSRAVDRVGLQQQSLDRARARVTAGFDGAPESARTAFFDDAESRMMAAAGYDGSRENMFLEYDAARVDRDRRLIEIDDMRARYDLQQRQARIDQQEAERVRREAAATATAGLTTDTRAVLDPADIVERELPPGATVTRALTKEEESIERKAAAIAHGDQAARDATVTARGPSSAAELDAKMAQPMGQSAEPEVKTEAEPVAVAAEQPAAEPVQATPAAAVVSQAKRSRAERYNSVPEAAKAADPDLYDADEIEEARARQAASAAAGEVPPAKASGAIRNASPKMNPQSAASADIEGYKTTAVEDGQKVEYREANTGRLAFTDEGDQVRMTTESAKSQRDMRAALTLAAQKFDQISISGSEEFRTRAVEQAAKLGLADKIANAELRQRAFELQLEETMARKQLDEMYQFHLDNMEAEEATVYAESTSGLKEPAQDQPQVEKENLKSTSSNQDSALDSDDDLKIISMQKGTSARTTQEHEDDDLKIIPMNKAQGVQTIAGDDEDDFKIISMNRGRQPRELGQQQDNAFRQSEGGGAIRARA